MVRYFFLLVLVVLSFFSPIWANTPNVLPIMADDLGAEALACYGNTASRLDRMALEGARFENAFATPVCSPTRAMILTGVYPNWIGIMEQMDSRLDPYNNNRLPANIKTIGHIFQEAGYATAIADKWHLGDFQDAVTSANASFSCLPGSVGESIPDSYSVSYVYTLYPSSIIGGPIRLGSIHQHHRH